MGQGGQQVSRLKNGGRLPRTDQAEVRRQISALHSKLLKVMCPTCERAVASPSTLLNSCKMIAIVQLPAAAGDLFSASSGLGPPGSRTTIKRMSPLLRTHRNACRGAHKDIDAGG